MRFASIARKTLEARGGTNLEFRGDEVLAVFISARQAIRAAVDLQAAFAEATITDPSFALPVGIGLDAGEAVEVEDGFRGGALNLAARLCSLAGAGEILASREVVHLARRVEGVSLMDRGSVQLKGLAEPVQLTRLTRDDWDPDSDAAYQRAIGRTTGRSGARFAVCPYRGLAAFQPDDADRFFGRDDLISDLVQRLERDRILFVVGPSGSGKSSLVRAGLIPALRSGAIPGSERWAVALFSPRGNPMDEMTYQIRRLAEWLLGDNHRMSTTSNARSLADAVCDMAGGLVMVIDQFEELFTLNRRAEQEAFVETLETIAESVGSRLRLALAMRADFYAVAATFPWLAWRATANQVLVGPMSRADMRKVIEQPAAAAGLRLEEGLVDAVLDDAGTGTASLPLVSHAMAETWRRRDGNLLTLEGYRGAGGVAGSIAQTADALFASAFDAGQQEVCRRLMLRLVTPGEGTSDARHRLPMEDLGRDHDSEVARKVVEEMTDARLLTVDRDSLEIAHEALLQSWPRLRRWIDDARDDLRTRQRINRAAAEWRAQERDPDLLYRGAPLQTALDWADERGDVLGPEEKEFLAAGKQAFLAAKARSEEAARRSRRLRRIAVSALAVLAIAAIAASLIAFRSLGESRLRYAQSLATQARLLATSDPRTAIALAAEASERTGTDPADARAALVTASQTLAARFVPSGSPISVGDALTVVVSPDGSLVVTGNRDGSISTWSASSGKRLATVPGHDDAINEMDFTPDGRRVVSGSDDGRVFLWDLVNPELPERESLGDTGDIVWSVAVAPDGATAASATEDGTIRLWDLEAREQVGPAFGDRLKDALTVSFSPNGELLMVGNGLGEVTGYDPNDRREVIPTFSAHGSDVWEIEFSPDGERFATASSDQRILIWKTSTRPEVIGEPFERSGWDVRAVLMDDTEILAGNEEGRLLIAANVDSMAVPTAFVPRHERIVDAAWGGGILTTLGTDQRMQIWTEGDDSTAVEIKGHTDGAYAIDASPDGDRIATGDGDGKVRVFSTSTGERQLGPVQLHEGRVWDLAWSEDGTRIASGGEDGNAKVIDAGTGDEVLALTVSDLPVTSLLYDGDRLVTGGDDQMVRIWSGRTLEDELGPHDGPVTDIALNPDGDLVVSDLSGHVRIWNLESGETEIDWQAEDNTVWGLSWSADDVLATASDDEVVQLWDMETQEPIYSLAPHVGGALDVAFLEDGATVVATSGEGAVRVWDAVTGAPLGSVLEGHDGAARRVIALPGMRFATSSEDGSVRIWDVLNPERACERAVGPLGLDALRDFLGDGEEPSACNDGT